jgi:putative heme-binding domain-containing protein
MPAGSTHHMVRKPDFLVSTDPWFRPVDVELGPDGALYVADWYNAIIAHVEVRLDHPLRDKQRGRIWRIVYRGTPEERANPARAAEIDAQFAGPGAVDWSVLGYQELLCHLGDRQVWKRRMAANQIMARFSGSEAKPLEALLKNHAAPTLARAEAFWLLDRRGLMDTDAMVRRFADPEPLIRSTALLAMADRGKDSGVPTEAVLPLLQDADATVRRDAVTLLRILDRVETLAQVHAAWPKEVGGDTLLDYSFAVTLRDLLKKPTMLERLGELAPAMLEDARIIRLACAIDQPEAAARLDAWLAAGFVPEDQRSAVLRSIMQYGDAALITARFLDPAALSGMSPEALRRAAQLLLENEARLAKRKLDFGPMLLACAERLAASSNPADLAVVFEISSRPAALLPQHAALAQTVLGDRSQEPGVRRWACTYLLRLDPEAHLPLALKIIRDPAERAELRRQCAEQAGKVAKTLPRFHALLEALAQAPYEVRLGAFFQMATNTPNVTLLLDAVERGEVSPVYLNNELTKMQIHWALKDTAINERVRALTARAPSQELETDRVVSAARAAYPTHAADIARGQALFEQNCLICHRMGGVGGNRAPNLDGAGQRGLDRLLQDILTPSRDIDPKYRNSIIALRDGRYERGLILSEGPKSLRVFNMDNEEIDLPREEVVSAEPVWSSPMPSNFSTLFQQEELLDLVAFLLKPPANLKLTAPEAP